MVGKSIGEGQPEEVMDLSRTLLVFSALVGAGLTALSGCCCRRCSCRWSFPLFKLLRGIHRHRHGAGGDGLSVHSSTPFPSPPSPAFCGPAGTCSGPPCWTWAPVVHGPAPDGAAGAGAEGGLLVDRRRHPVGESLLKVPLCALRIRSGTVDPRRHRPKGAWAMEPVRLPHLRLGAGAEPGRYRCPAGHS